MGERTNVRLCVSAETKKIFRKLAADLDIELNQAVRFGAEIASNHIKDFKKLIAKK